jgi:deoxyadenosine/deoxycytidine kinase
MKVLNTMDPKEEFESIPILNISEQTPKKNSFIFKEKSQDHKVQIISVDGNIGAGKSTFLDHLVEFYKDDPTVVILKEPVDKWSSLMDPDSNSSLLESYYSSPITYAFPFQVYIFQTMIQAIDETLRANPECLTLITERSILSSCEVFTKMLHDHEIMNPLEYQIYLNMYSLIPNIEKYIPNKIFYLKLDPYMCHEHVTMRDRKGEDDISMDYLEECNLYYEKWLKDLKIKHILHDLDMEPKLEQIRNNFIKLKSI